VRSDLAPFGMGGEELRRAGVELVAESREVAVVGITEALRVLPRAREIFRQLLDEVEKRRPRVALLVDFPEFNLRLARQLEKRGVRVVYYVSPQVWAWRRGRVKSIARTVDRMLVLFPFEEQFYRGHAVEVEHVGHPLVDEVPELPQAWDSPSAHDGVRRIALLPGSRPSEVSALLPVMLAGVAALARELPVEATIVRAQTVDHAAIVSHLTAPELVAAKVSVRVVDSEERFAAIAGSHLALCASGTATLEVALLRTPLLVLYRLQRWSYWLGKLLVDLPFFSLVNLVLGEKAVPELLQGEASAEGILAAALPLLRDERRRMAMRGKLAEVRPRLGEGGASCRAARAVDRMLGAVEAAA